MNKQIDKLYLIAGKQRRLIVGLMSGTSMDGLDIALCGITGSGKDTALEVLRFDTKSYPPAFRSRVREVFAKRTIDQQVLCGLHALVGRTHGSLVNEALREWGLAADDIDVVASHGQTVFHAPQSLTGDADYPNSTLQLGDGDHVAVTTGIITISDFRQKHIAAGGEGAPLAAYGDYLLFSDERETRVLLNIGGIANFTFLPAPPGTAAARCFATDVGPGNTLMDQCMQAQLGVEMDLDARVARGGAVNERLLQALLGTDFFGLPFPKTTGPELFNLHYLAKAQQATATTGLGVEDVMATLSAFSASAITTAIRHVARGCHDLTVYVSGGGLHNPLLMDHIRQGLGDTPVVSFHTLGLPPDAKEAALFAVLANETLAGAASNVHAIADAPQVCMGKISLPQ